MKLQTYLNRIQRDFFIYAFFVLLLTFWNLFGAANEEANTTSQLIRGAVRFTILLYLALQISSLRKGIWWISVVFAGFLGVGAVVAAVLGGIVGSVYATESTNMPMYLGQLLIPAAFLLDALYVLLKKEVREGFVK